MGIVLFVAGALLVTALFVGMVLAEQFLFDYRLSETGVELLFFRRLPFMRIPFESISSVSLYGDGPPETLRETMFAARLGNRLWRLRRAVSIRKRRGLTRLIVITPEDPERFVQEVNLRLPGPIAAEAPV